MNEISQSLAHSRNSSIFFFTWTFLGGQIKEEFTEEVFQRIGNIQTSLFHGADIPEKVFTF